MANVLSRVKNAFETWSFKYNCYEAVHPWTPHCSDSALEMGITVFEQAFKLYTPLYLFSQVMSRKYDYGAFQRTTQSILRSTTFISANAFFALLFFCSSQYLTGKFYYYSVAYMPAFLASSMAVMIEKPNRRSSLAFYVANVASETLYRISVGRGYFKPVPKGQVYIFTLSIATLMWLAKKHGFEDDPLSSAIKLIVGHEEAAARQGGRSSSKEAPGRKINKSVKRLETIPEDHRAEKSAALTSSETSLESSLPPGPMRADMSMFERWCNIFNWVKFFLTARHRLCPHSNSCSCIYYASRAFLRALAIGSGAQFCLRLIPRLRSIFFQDQKLSLATKLFNSTTIIDSSLFKMGLFLSSFSGIYKLTNCWLRWSLDTSAPINCFLAGLLAGPTLLFYPSPTVALYVLWKCLEALFHEAVRKNLIKNKNLFIVILYGLSTSQLFYSALMDPRYMKKSYMAFLHRMSKHKLHMVNRSVLDVFGTEASSGYEEFFPDLHPKYMSQAYLGSIWIWMIEQKLVIAKRFH